MIENDASLTRRWRLGLDYVSSRCFRSDRNDRSLGPLLDRVGGFVILDIGASWGVVIGDHDNLRIPATDHHSGSRLSVGVFEDCGP
ncbi:hypothetical protein [Rhodococcus koreensis]